MNGRSLLVLLSFVVALGCDETTDPDGGPDDAGAVDAGDDAGGGMDAGPPAVDCSMAAGDDLWTPPEGLPPFADAERGRVVKCGTIDPLDAATVDDRARNPFNIEAGTPGGYEGETLTEGTERTLVLYRSERRNGSGGFSSGTLYLPSSGAMDLPLIVHVSGTTGIAEDCAPSRGRFKDLEQTLYVLVGRGNAVFVPDLIGLGTPGTLAYLESAEAAHATLDGARAALAAAPAGRLNGQIFISGHSAGAHAALVSQALQRAYAPELDLVGVSSMGGVWFDTAVFGELLTASAYSTAGSDGWNVVYGAFYFIGHTAAYDGEDRAYEVIHPDRRDAVRTAFETYCLDPAMPGDMDVREALEALASNVSEVFEPGLAASFSSRVFCDAGIMDRCPARVAEWLMRFEADRPPLDPMGAPVWFHQGSLDARSTVSSMQCPILEAADRGVDVDTCYYVGVEHGPLSGAAAPWHADWVAALAAGRDAPACPDVTPFPAGDPTACGLMSDTDAGSPMDAGTPDAGSPDAGIDAG